MNYTPRADDGEVAYLVGGQWFECLSEVWYLEDEHRFVTKRDGEPFEIHLQGAHIQAILWPVDQ